MGQKIGVVRITDTGGLSNVSFKFFAYNTTVDVIKSKLYSRKELEEFARIYHSYYDKDEKEKFEFNTCDCRKFKIVEGYMCVDDDTFHIIVCNDCNAIIGDMHFVKNEKPWWYKFIDTPLNNIRANNFE